MKQLADKKVKGSLLGVFSRTIARTPVDTGRLRNNWHTSIGRASEGKRKSNKSGANAISNASEVMLKKFKLGNTVYFSNNLPYAGRVEYGSWSKQAPRGMLRVSILELQNQMDKIR